MYLLCQHLCSGFLGASDCCAVQNSDNVPVQCNAIIKIAPDDPVYKSTGKTCMSFRRAATSTSALNCPIFPQVPVSINL